MDVHLAPRNDQSEHVTVTPKHDGFCMVNDLSYHVIAMYLLSLRACKLIEVSPHIPVNCTVQHAC